MTELPSPYNPRKHPKQERSKACVNAILDATARILLDEGVPSASTNRIAEVAGVSIGSLYEYFPGKESIFAKLRQRLNERMFKVLVNSIGDLSRISFSDAIDQIVQARIDEVLVDPALHFILKDKIPASITIEESNRVIQTVYDTCIRALSVYQSEMRPGTTEFIVDVAMTTMYALIEHLAKTEPNKLRNLEYTGEIKILMRNYIMR